MHDRKKKLLEGLSENTYHHDRTQSLPSSKIVAMHLTSKSWVADMEHKSLDLSSEDYSPAQRLPRSSSFSRARVLETSSIKTVEMMQGFQHMQVKTVFQTAVKVVHLLFKH